MKKAPSQPFPLIISLKNIASLCLMERVAREKLIFHFGYYLDGI